MIAVRDLQPLTDAAIFLGACPFHSDGDLLVWHSLKECDRLRADANRAQVLAERARRFEEGS